MATGRRRASKRGSERSRGKRPTTGRAPHANAKHATTPKKRWSAGVMRKSDALDLEQGVFTKRSPRQIALSLKHSAEASRRRKSAPYQSAMSMLTFHINRGGSGLTAERRRVLNQAKVELRSLFGR